MLLKHGCDNKIYLMNINFADGKAVLLWYNIEIYVNKGDGVK